MPAPNSRLSIEGFISMSSCAKIDIFLILIYTLYQKKKMSSCANVESQCTQAFLFFFLYFTKSPFCMCVYLTCELINNSHRINASLYTCVRKKLFKFNSSNGQKLIKNMHILYMTQTQHSSTCATD
jgi:hypothetical protein